jgi:hypothetical protein
VIDDALRGAERNGERRYPGEMLTADLRAAGTLLRALQPIGESQPRE